MKTYKVVDSNRWGGKIQGKPDPEGYYMHTITVEGHTNSPIDYKAKTFPEPGSMLQGELVEYVSNAGNTRMRLETAEYKKKDNAIQDKIVAQFALRLAVENSPDITDKTQLVSLAKYFIECVEELV